MNDIMQKYKEKLLIYWQQLEKGQKTKLILVAVFLVASLVLFTMMATRTKYELAYVGLDQKTAGKVVTRLEEMGVSYQLSAGGSNIAVPESEVDKVLVALAPEVDSGSGSIYSKFWEKASFGMTDDQLRILERGAIEEELRGLIRGIEGIKDAYVMVTIPKNQVFYSKEQEKATASVVVETEPGVTLSQNQIKSIYNLISMSIPNLPVENITLTDQYGDSLEYDTYNQGTGVGSFDQQRQIQQEFQNDLKRDIESMLRKIMGPDKVSVNVFAKMNFDQKRTVENLKQPVVDGKGIARSVETIQESFYGDGATQGGVYGTGDSQIPGYPSVNSDSGSYELMEERINYDVNEITKEVISSPYSLEDLSIIVAVDLPNDGANTEQTIEAIKELIRPIVSAALDDQEVDIDSKIAVVAHEFEGEGSIFDNNKKGIDPMLLYGAIGLSILAIGGVGYTVVKRNRKKDEFEEEEDVFSEAKAPEFDFSPVLTEEAILQQEIQKLSKQKPQEFIKLLRTWLSED